MGAVELIDVAKTYKGGVQALKGVSLLIPEGSFYAVLGPNGAGKSTLIGIISSLVNKSRGKVKVGGFDLDKNPEDVRRLLGLVPQEFNLNVFERVMDIVMTQAGYYGIPAKEARPRAEKWLKKLHLWDKRDEISRNLSGGMKRRLMIARAMMHHPKILILDEPTAGVDVEIRRDIWDFVVDLNKGGCTIVLTTHYLEEVEQLCERVAIINQGSLLEDTSVRNLISRMNTQKYLIDLDRSWEQNIEIPGCVILSSGMQLEVEINADFDMNLLFSYLNEKKLKILGVRPKTNRIEELFMNVIDSNKPEVKS